MSKNIPTTQEVLDAGHTHYSMEQAKDCFTDTIDLFCQFSERLELNTNKPTYSFMARRMDFLDEEVNELREAISEKDDVEILDGAIDSAFVAITQAYHLLRKRGKTVEEATVGVRAAMIRVGLTNMVKTIPTEQFNKISKPEGWEAPCFTNILA